MLWKLDGMRLSDFLPVPKNQPGRHFSSGYHMLGKTASSYDVKYAQMTYGDHYRKKIEEEILRERKRLDGVMMETSRQALEQKRALQSAQKKSQRYNLNELRHHQRRCAALLFGARQQGSHEVPFLVRWAPRRRESYYLMSERVYNDRLLMKLREEEERRKKLESPIEFDWSDKLGDTRHLYDFQNLINQTSKSIKGMNFDTQYKNYDYDFNQGEKIKSGEQQERTIRSSSKESGGKESTNQTSKQIKVRFNDVTDCESDSHEDRLRRERRRAVHTAGESDRLGIGDIELDLFSPDVQGMGQNDSSIDGLDDEDFSFRDLLSSVSLDTVSQGDINSTGSGRTRKSVSDFESGSNVYSLHNRKSCLQNVEVEEREDSVSELGGAHNNKYCKHSPANPMKTRSQDYYKMLPRLLRTSELREKASKLKGKTSEQPTGPFVNHECMKPYKTAYERALSLVRGRSLPEHYTDLWNKTSRLTFSYIPGMPGTESTVLKDKKGGERRLNMSTAPSGLEGILGDVDMNDFYREEDELIYYIKSEKLDTVVQPSSKDADSSDESSEDESSSSTLTRATSGSYTLKLKSSLNTDAQSAII